MLTPIHSQTPFYQGKTLKIIKEMPRDAEIIDLLKKFTGVEPLPAR